MYYILLGFLFSFRPHCLPVYCPALSTIQGKTYESLSQSISPLFIVLSCWVSMSHVRALAVKTSVDGVSTDMVPPLNLWPLKLWEQASRSPWFPHRAAAPKCRRQSDGCGTWALLMLTYTPVFTEKPKTAICCSAPIKKKKKWKSANQHRYDPPVFFFPWAVFLRKSSQQMVKETIVWDLADELPCKTVNTLSGTLWVRPR